MLVHRSHALLTAIVIAGCGGGGGEPMSPDARARPVDTGCERAQLEAAIAAKLDTALTDPDIATSQDVTVLLETFGGLAILLGFLTRPIAFILAGETAVIFWWMHVGMMGRGSIFPIANGGEAAVLYCFTFLYLVFAGPGAFAIDGLIKRRAEA